jgi:NADPH-dependent 2,4-dienoyl-CoA reductase/sulfur reductase-like enzyme
MRPADMVLVVAGVRPDTDLAKTAGAALGVKGAVAVDRGMRTSLPNVFAARGLRDHSSPAAG